MHTRTKGRSCFASVLGADKKAVQYQICEGNGMSTLSCILFRKLYKGSRMVHLWIAVAYI